MSRIGALVVALVLLLVAAPARARDASPHEVRALASRATTDPRGLVSLRRVTTVDGRPFDIDGLLAGSDEAERRARLRVLAGAATGSVGDPAAARRRASAILDSPRYRGTALPRPFKGLLDRLGDLLRRVLDVLSGHLPGGRATVWAVLGGIVIAVVLVSASRLSRRRGRSAPAPSGGGVEPPDPAALEAAADEAEGAGHFERAVRLRFGAGLLRLERTRVLDLRPSSTVGELVATLGSPPFTDLASTFQAIVYGGRPADRADAESARRGWGAVLAGARSRGRGAGGPA